jgi:sterol desaturase/sphingolipid hydroxylase (fatty acid hydroxylase superfamily)
MTVAAWVTVGVSIAFLAAERVSPGRPLPAVRGWYLRAIAVNLAQLVITLATGRIWSELLGLGSLFQLASWQSPMLEGFAAWFAGTFVFYWWHRLRHWGPLWRIFHQVHHSPARIEVLTSFYKHPLEIAVNSLLSAALLFPLLGCSLLAGVWYNCFAATGEYFYHANLESPRWLRYLIQTPELHSIHHQYDVHAFNYGDIPLWDRLFGTFRAADGFAERCGFPDGAEQRLGDMLRFRDVYEGERSN